MTCLTFFIVWESKRVPRRFFERSRRIHHPNRHIKRTVPKTKTESRRHRIGDLMNRTIQGAGRIRHIGSPTGIVGGLLLISLGLQLLAHQVFGQTDIGTLLWAHYLGFWSYILGTTGFLFLSVQWLIEWRHVRASPGARPPWSSDKAVVDFGLSKRLCCVSTRKMRRCTQLDS